MPPDSADILEGIQRKEHIERLRAYVLGGGQLDRTNALWLLEQAEGGFWGRMALSAHRDARKHRMALRLVVRALLDMSGLGWTRQHWRPILDVLHPPRPRDADDGLPPLPDLTRVDIGIVLDSGMRVTEQGEVRTVFRIKE